MKKRGPNLKLTLLQAAAYIGRSPGRLRNILCEDNRPKSYKEHGRLVFWSHDLDAWQDLNRQVRHARYKGIEFTDVEEAS